VLENPGASTDNAISFESKKSDVMEEKLTEKTVSAAAGSDEKDSDHGNQSLATQSFNAEFLFSTPLVVNILFFMSARFRTKKIILVLKIWLSFFINQSTNPGATRFHLS
jgi:hypothetical protein